MSNRIIIAGGREFNDKTLMCESINTLIEPMDISTIEFVSGKARGADTLGEQLGRANGIPIAEFPANWDKYGKSAGYRRNAEMAAYSTHLIAFWDGKSVGTKHMIDLATKANLNVTVVRY
jgi:hypothetical protein